MQRVAVPLLSSGITLLVYLLTLAPDLTWANSGQDGGDLITAAITGGIPHPPGYPTYLLLTRLFSFLPFGTVALRFNLFSALCAAATAGLITAIALRRSFREPPAGPLPPLAAGLSLAFMPLVWGQALIAEVYTLNLLFLALFLVALLVRRSGFAAGLLLGLSVTTHLTSLLMLPLALVLLPAGQLRRFLLAFPLGLLPYLLLPLRAVGHSPVVWGEPTTPAGWWWLVSAHIYQPNLFALPAARWWPRLAEWGGAFAAQFAGAGLLLLPAALLRRPRWQSETSAILATALLYAFYAFTYDAPDAALFFLPGLLLLSILLADGLRVLRGAALVLPLTLLVLNFSTQNLSQDRRVRQVATTVLQEAPEQAILLAPGDQTIFTLWYFQHVEGYRPDLVLVDGNLFAFDWYRRRLGRQYPDLVHLAVDDLPAFREQNRHRPLCDVALAASPALHCS